jgi:hypothetical protein
MGHRRRLGATRTALATLLAAAGCLLSAAGCGVPTSADPVATGVAGPASAGPGKEFHVYRQGQPQASEDPYASAPRGPTPSPTPLDRDPAPADPACPDLIREGVIEEVSVTPGSTSLTATWPAAAGNVRHYLITAVWQRDAPNQPDPTWTTAAPTARCGDVTATLTGLRPGSYYSVILRAVTTTAVEGRTVDTVIRRSLVRTAG